jgi:hypothetical protein
LFTEIFFTSSEKYIHPLYFDVVGLLPTFYNTTYSTDIKLLFKFFKISGLLPAFNVELNVATCDEPY